ncbi:MAG: biosynthetic-type acetolactate synthase large subunit [Victivallales bacterium]
MTAPNQDNLPIKGAEITIKTLERLGVDTVFAYPGGAAIEFHQALKDSSIRVILPRNEQGGAFAADGYARVTGKTGVCMATSGPGATNLLTGIADAYMDSIPMVIITGQVATSFIGKNAFQETDIIGMTRPIVKHSYLVLAPEDIVPTIVNAFYLANSGRPGPVLIDIPKNIQQAKLPFVFNPEPTVQAYSIPGAPAKEQIDAIRDAIAKSERPCLYAGGGIIAADAAKELTEFAEKYDIPVVTTLMGVGSIPEDHPLSLKWLGMHGTYYANYAANECDLLLAFGARFDDRVTGSVEYFAQDAKIVHVDIDQSEINKNVRADIGVVANIRDVLIELNKDPVRKERPVWKTAIRMWKKQHPLSYRKEAGVLKPQSVIETICRLTNGEAVIVPGVGQHQMWAAQFYTFKYPRQLLTSGGLGSMGFGLPAAMGAKLAVPEKTVINIDGDGSFQMNIQELGTVFAEDIPVKMVILNNQHLGMVAQWEDRFYGSRRGNTDLTMEGQRPYPDFVTIAKGYEIPGREVWNEEELEDAVREMLEAKGPFLLDCHTFYHDHVLPMIPPGKTYKDILTE